MYREVIDDIADFICDVNGFDRNEIEMEYLEEGDIVEVDFRYWIEIGELDLNGTQSRDFKFLIKLNGQLIDGFEDRGFEYDRRILGLYKLHIRELKIKEIIK